MSFQTEAEETYRSMVSHLCIMIQSVIEVAEIPRAALEHPASLKTWSDFMRMSREAVRDSLRACREVRAKITWEVPDDFSREHQELIRLLSAAHLEPWRFPDQTVK